MSARLPVGAVAIATSVGLCVSLRAQPANQPEVLPQIRVTAKRPHPAQHRQARRRPVTTATRARAPVAAGTGPAPAPAAPATPTTTQAGGPGVRNAPGQTVSTISTSQFQSTPEFEIGDMLQYSPGISIKQGNGPRDEGISIRGSNARNAYGIRNIVVEEDGFPVTQPDGLSRSDLIDPHAYSGFNVYRGPSSAMFGNYATGGAINFHTWTGAQIDGFWYGAEGGSFGYLNNYVAVGRKVGPLEYSLFASDVRGNGFIDNSVFDTQTVNFLGSYALTPNDLVTMKVINNFTGTELPIRLSLTQFEQNPFQKGCLAAATAAPGCATVSLDANGYSAPTVPNTAGQAGLGRHDRRTIAGVRWEHDFDNDTTLRTQFVFDDKDINQPTGTTSAIGDSPAYNIMSDLIHRYSLFGLGLTSTAGVFYDTERLSNFTYNVAPGGNATLGALSSFYNGGQQESYGARVREEVKFNDAWTGVVGADIEKTQISTADTIFSFPGGVPVPSTVFPIDTQYPNHAWEAGLLYHPTDAWQFRGRVATGYGTPNISQLTVTSAGVAGNNTDLKSQTNLGYDLGADYTPNNTTKISVTGFYEFFTNEQVTQSPGAGLMSYTFNAPASQHRGVEAAVDWRPEPGWRFIAAYTYIDEFYTNYLEQLSAGVFTATFNRYGNKIPGVSPNELLTRVAYDQPTGAWKGLGGFVEYQFKDGYFIDNANLVKVPAYGVFNLNIHYVIELTQNDLKSATLFFEVKNVFNKTFVASANDVTDTLNSTTGAENPGSVLATTGTGSIYAGAPRSFVGGFKLAFR
jgi:iron complex outermembrane recepter protein